MLSAYSRTPEKDLWWTYLAEFENQPGSVVVNLALKSRAPLTDYQHLVVTGVRFSSSTTNGLPDVKDIDALNALAEKRLTVISQKTPLIRVGVFTHDGERLDYIYIRDKVGVEDVLKKFYQDVCPERKTYINLKDDPKWEAYLDFLFPNEHTVEFYRHELVKIGYLAE